MNKCRKFFYRNRVLGFIKRFLVYKPLQKIYGFNSWHLGPLSEKRYAVDIIDKVEEITSEDKSPIVEIGCGRGDIIGNIRHPRKIGIDLSPEVIKAARLFHHDTEFIAGGFDKTDFGDISCLIMVNFIHAICPNEMHSYMKNVFTRNNVKFVCFDVLTNIEYTEYKYMHSGSEMLGDDYELFHTDYKYPAAHWAFRHIEYWRKKE